ncbi:diacylglycerol diphosphate phosphatase, partial [Acrasis kona]
MGKPHLWWSAHYLLDWFLLTIVLFLAEVLFGQAPGIFRPSIRAPVYLEDNDADLKYPSLPDIVPAYALMLINVLAPIFLFVVIQIKYRSKHDLHHSILGLYKSLVLTILITDIFKVYGGRERPNYLASCMPDAKGTCTNKNLAVSRDAALSFPSGHSSVSFGCMVFLSCYLAGKLKVFNKDGGSVWKSLTCLVPLIVAGLVAVSRTLDYHHHHSDIIAGSVIGAVIGFTSYLTMYYPLTSKHCRHPKNRYFSIKKKVEPEVT